VTAIEHGCLWAVVRSDRIRPIAYFPRRSQALVYAENYALFGDLYLDPSEPRSSRAPV
jgi:hypothetical protein